MTDKTKHNGDSKVSVETIQRDDWVLFIAGEPAPPLNELPRLLNLTLEQWLAEHPRCRVRTALPIVQAGHTAAIRVWFDT